jgi:hypothetical protein
VSDTVTLKVSMPKGTYRAVQQAAEQKHKTESVVVVEAVQVYLEQSQAGPLLGLFADEPDLIDEIASEAMRGRQDTPINGFRRWGIH